MVAKSGSTSSCMLAVVAAIVSCTPGYHLLEPVTGLKSSTKARVEDSRLPREGSVLRYDVLVFDPPGTGSPHPAAPDWRPSAWTWVSPLLRGEGRLPIEGDHCIDSTVLSSIYSPYRRRRTPAKTSASQEVEAGVSTVQETSTDDCETNCSYATRVGRRVDHYGSTWRLDHPGPWTFTLFSGLSSFVVSCGLQCSNAQLGDAWREFHRWRSASPAPLVGNSGSYAIITSDATTGTDNLFTPISAHADLSTRSAGPPAHISVSGNHVNLAVRLKTADHRRDPFVPEVFDRGRSGHRALNRFAHQRRRAECYLMDPTSAAREIPVDLRILSGRCECTTRVASTQPGLSLSRSSTQQLSSVDPTTVNSTSAAREVRVNLRTLSERRERTTRVASTQPGFSLSRSSTQQLSSVPRAHRTTCQLCPQPTSAWMTWYRYESIDVPFVGLLLVDISDAIVLLIVRPFADALICKRTNHVSTNTHFGCLINGSHLLTPHKVRHTIPLDTMTGIVGASGPSFHRYDQCIADVTLAPRHLCMAMTIFALVLSSSQPMLRQEKMTSIVGAMDWLRRRKRHRSSCRMGHLITAVMWACFSAIQATPND